MATADRWLLPDGVEELLPLQAEQVEQLRRKLLDLYHSWGYQLVMPPLIEFTDSLLVGLGSDIDLQTFKVVDQLSGRTMGIRADITLQTARIDAHSLCREGPARMCYAGSVLHTRPKSLMASRSPIQLGAELYGDGGLASDVEIIALMLATLQASGVEKITLDLGHVGIYRALIDLAQPTVEQERRLFDALQRKSAVDIEQAINDGIDHPAAADMLRGLSQLNGDSSVLEQARTLLAAAPGEVGIAIDRLEQVAERIQARMPEVAVYFDLSEQRGFNYHTGLVFSALAPGFGQALANGGRYDDIGEVFGRARPATGFNTDLKALLGFLPAADSDAGSILVVAGDDLSPAQDSELWQTVQQLRGEGERVVFALSSGMPSEVFERQLVLSGGHWLIEPRH